jgi:hypothetical protein
MHDAKLTIRLPTDELQFAKAYAREHRLTVTALIQRFLQQLRVTQAAGVPPSLDGIAGLVPPDVDARAEYVAGRQERHR